MKYRANMNGFNKNKWRLRNLVNDSYSCSTQTYTFNISESMKSYHRGTSYEHLALNQFYGIHLSHQLSDQLYKCQRNAIWYFLHAALKGYSSAQYKLGLLYLNGQMGLDSNKTTAQKWFLLAANQGHIDAQNQLERLYQQ